MAIVEIPASMDLHRYKINVCNAILPLNQFQKEEGLCTCFAYSYRVEQEKQSAFEEAVKEYTENVSTVMSYLSKNSLRREFDGVVHVIATIGIALSAVIALIGILNFINAVLTGIIARKREFAMLQSIGMTDRQLQTMLVYEGISYVVTAGVLSLFLGSFLARQLFTALNNVILFFQYRFQILPFLIILPLLLAAAILAPLMAYRKTKRKSIVERLRETDF